MHPVAECRSLVRSLAIVGLVGVFLLPGLEALAGPSRAAAIKQLTEGSSINLRVQAALMLGFSDSEEAVGPLCRALDDESAVVRMAAASALSRVRKPLSLDCLKTRSAKEPNRSVKSKIDSVHARIARDVELRTLATASRAPVRGGRFYVAVEDTVCRVEERRQYIETLVQAVIRRSLLADQGIGLAPPGQAEQRFVELAKDAEQEGYLLRPTVESVEYDGAKVWVALRLRLVTFPSMALRGEYTPRLSMTIGASKPDLEAEDALLEIAAQGAVEKFLETIR